MSLTRAFLASGVPSVIATLWQVEDAPAKQLFVGLHAAWAEGYDSAEALRRAQLAMARQEQSRLADWGAVVMVGKPVTR
jgi:CHAT domain-containing protein